MSKDKVVIFTDGACSGNPGPGGWAAILVSPLGKVRELGGAEAHTTNNKMEIRAALEALLSLTQVKRLSTKEISLYTDSKYLIGGITGWVHGWKRNGWKTAAGKEVANRGLWEALDEIVRKHEFKIDWLYVAGHSGNPGNERCDEIAVEFSQGRQARLFQGDRESYPIAIEKVPGAVAAGSPKGGARAPVYVSLIDGRVFRDSTWKACEARVKGVAGAKFKKVSGEAEEEALLKNWGV